MKKINETHKLLAALSYLFVLALIPYVFGHGNKFVSGHAKQGIRLLLIELALMVVFLIPLIGWIIFPIGWVYILICSVLGISHAMSGKTWELPFVSGFFKK